MVDNLSNQDADRAITMFFAHYSSVELPHEWSWKNFSPKEMACRGSDSLLIVRPFMDRLQAFRDSLGFSFPVTSGYRSPEHNKKVSSTGSNGPHTTGRAVDINVWGERAYLVLTNAAKFGFTGIGSNQKGSILTKRFIHLDDLEPSMGRHRPTTWTY